MMIRRPVYRFSTGSSIVLFRATQGLRCWLPVFHVSSYSDVVDSCDLLDIDCPVYCLSISSFELTISYLIGSYLVNYPLHSYWRRGWNHGFDYHYQFLYIHVTRMEGKDYLIFFLPFHCASFIYSPQRML